MAINRIIHRQNNIDQDLINLINDDVTASDVINNKYVHLKDGTRVQGTCTYDADTSDANITAADIISNKIAYANGVKIIGTMPNNGNLNASFALKNANYSIPTGFTTGGNIKISETEQNKILPENIKNGISILGVNGTFTNDANATATDILLNKTAYINGAKITGTMLDYNSFPLFAQTYQKFTVTLSSNQSSFPLPSINLNGRPIKFIFIYGFGTMNGISKSKAGNTSPFICYLTYMSNKTTGFLNSTTSDWIGRWFGLSVKISYNTSRVASLNNQIIATDSGFTIENENLLSSGGATVTTSSPAFYGYFLRDCLYSVVVGG